MGHNCNPVHNNLRVSSTEQRSAYFSECRNSAGKTHWAFYKVFQAKSLWDYLHSSQQGTMVLTSFCLWKQRGHTICFHKADCLTSSLPWSLPISLLLAKPRRSFCAVLCMCRKLFQHLQKLNMLMKGVKQGSHFGSFLKHLETLLFLPSFARAWTLWQLAWHFNRCYQNLCLRKHRITFSFHSFSSKNKSWGWLWIIA